MATILPPFKLLLLDIYNNKVLAPVPTPAANAFVVDQLTTSLPTALPLILLPLRDKGVSRNNKDAMVGNTLHQHLAQKQPQH
jgi:hypothetical protein